MQVNLCFGCMEPTDSYPCPHCGYTPSQKGAEWALQPGSILNGKYMIGRILGQGGFGITYIGWDIALEKKVAVKEYYPSGQVGRTPGTNALSWYTNESAALARQAGLEMFLKEARKMSKVDDVSGIVRVRDLFQENQTAYIVMDYVEGETLKARLQKTGPMAWDQAKGIFQPAIRAMEQVHKAGLIHRDLSPDNLMLTPDAQVKILDLGAAKDLSINSGASSMQVAKSGFSPFEQYSQRGGSGPWTDVYAMAATVYYTLTGVLPPAAIDRVEEDTIDWSLVSALPGRAREALRAAMAVSAKKRTQSMEELEKGLFEVPAQEPKPKPAPKPKLEKKTTPKPGPEKKAWKKGWVAAVAVVVVVALCGVGLGGKAEKSSTIPTETQKLVETEALGETVAGSGTVMDNIASNDILTSMSAIESKQTASIAAGEYHTVGLHNDGTVIATGQSYDGRCNVSNWRDIIAVAAGSYHTVGLRSNGTVVAVGWQPPCYTECWRDIVAIAAGNTHTVGLQSNGTVVAVGENKQGQCNVTNWQNIVAIAAAGNHTVGLRSDGTVVAVGENKCGQCNVSSWKNIVAIAAGYNHTVGILNDGSVIATGYNAYGQCNVDSWSNVVAVAAGQNHTVGLLSDGSVVALGHTDYGQCNVDHWKYDDIVAIAAGYDYTVGLRSDGTVVSAGFGYASDGTAWPDSSISTWTNIRTP